MATAPINDDYRGVDALACDGGIITVRPIRPDDRDCLAALFHGASPESLFIPPGTVLIAAELDSLCRPETNDRLSLVGLDGREIVGVASCVRLDPAARVAGVAALVADDHHGRGIGTLLLEHLAGRARRAGITEFIRDTLPGHTPRQAVDARDRVAERASLRPLLAPRSVAVVGAGRRRGSVGHETLRALRDYGFRGRLYAVNPDNRPVCGIATFRSPADLPEPVDLVVLAVRADLVPGMLASAGRRGARAAVVLSKGFGASPAHRRQRDEMLRIARRHGMRLLGPGSLGVIGTAPETRLDACLSVVRPPTGGLAVGVQSGAIGVALLDHAERAGCGISQFVSLGEELDVSSDELIAHWYDDPATRAVALHLDFPGDPGRFARTVRALGRRKPVLAIESGRTADLAPGSIDALFAQAGVIRTASAEELVDTARLLIGQPLPTGPRTAIVGNAGGLISLAAANAAALGLTVVPLTAETRAQLPAGSDNPVLLPVDARPATIADAAEIVAHSGEIDILLLMIVATRATVPARTMTALGEAADNHPHITVSMVLSGSTDDTSTLGRRGAPVYRRPDQALRSLAHALRYATWRRRPLGRRPDLSGLPTERARTLIDQGTTARTGSLPPCLAAEILGAYGIGVGSARPAAAVELTAGIRHDPMFGSLVYLGAAAGVPVAPVERLLPLTDLDARSLWRDLSAALTAHGRREPLTVDTGKLEDVLLRLSRLAEDHPEIAELELAPLHAGPAGITASAVRLRLAGSGRTEPDVPERGTFARGPGTTAGGTLKSGRRART